jgi:hypothetical protein
MMERDAGTQPINNEHKIAAIVRRLPPERSTQVLADERWNALFAAEAGQTALDKLADEALADIRAGKAGLMVFTPDGEIAPG